MTWPPRTSTSGSGTRPFLGAGWRAGPFGEWLIEASRRFSAYRESGTLDVGALPRPREREVIERALAREEDRRFPSCAELVQALLA